MLNKVGRGTAPWHHFSLFSFTDLHYCASVQEVFEEGQSSAETATHYCTPPYSGWRWRQTDNWTMYWIYLYGHMVTRLYRSKKGLNTGDPALTLACCFWIRPLVGEFLLPWETAFIMPCLLLCYRYGVERWIGVWRRKEEKRFVWKKCLFSSALTVFTSQTGNEPEFGSPLTCVGIKGERGEWFRPPSWRCELKLVAVAGWGLTMAVSLWEVWSALLPWERLMRAQGGRR